MRNILFLSLLLFCVFPAFSQKNYFNPATYKVDTIFPYNFPLVDLDSTKVLNSKDVMALAKKGKVKGPTVIAFWLTTCIPCHNELATYTANYESWKKQANFNMYAISIDFPHNFRKIAAHSRKKQFPFEVLWDRDRMYRTVLPGELNGLPQVFIFDKNGKLAYKHKGFVPGDELTLFQKIKELQ